MPAAPRLIPFQGHLTRPVADGTGEFRAVPDGTYTMAFNLYTTPAGGESLVWGPERHERVAVRGGLVNVLIGSVRDLPGATDEDGDFFGRVLYVGVTVDADGKSATPNLELVPRQALVPTVYAVWSGTSTRALDADHAKVANVANDAERLGEIEAGRVLSVEPTDDGNLKVHHALDSDRLGGRAFDDFVRSEPPVGSIMPFFGSPESLDSTNWGLCDGGTVADVGPGFVDANAELEGVQKPDLQGRFLRGLVDSEEPPTNEALGFPGGRDWVPDQSIRHRHVWGAVEQY